jgi:hypothetical protein
MAGAGQRRPPTPQAGMTPAAPGDSSRVSFVTYDSIRDPINPPPTKLLPEFRQNGGCCFNTGERDFAAVYSR